MRNKFFFGTFAVLVVIFLFFVFFTGVSRAQTVKLAQPVHVSMATQNPVSMVVEHEDGVTSHAQNIVGVGDESVVVTGEAVKIVHRSVVLDHEWDGVAPEMNHLVAAVGNHIVVDGDVMNLVNRVGAVQLPREKRLGEVAGSWEIAV